MCTAYVCSSLSSPAGPRLLAGTKRAAKSNRCQPKQMPCLSKLALYSNPISQLQCVALQAWPVNVLWLSVFFLERRGCFSAFCLVAGMMSMRPVWCPVGRGRWRNGSVGVGWFTRLMTSHWAWSPGSVLWLLHLLETGMTDGVFFAIGWS